MQSHTRQFLIRFLAITLLSFPLLASANPLLDEVAAAYGGKEALGAIRTAEIEWVGYYYMRYQSRYAEAPWDRLPIRSYTALDFENRTSAVDNISTWPGELNMGTRTINAGDETWTLNTISQIYTDGAMHDFDYAWRSEALRTGWMLVRTLLENPDAVEQGERVTRYGIDYDVLVYRGRDVLVHPETRLIYAVEGTLNRMHEEPTTFRRVFTHYFERDGIMMNRRYQSWSGDEPAVDMALASSAIDEPVDRLMEIPDGFVRVPSTDGYSGEPDIGVRKIGNRVFVAGNGETRILYVEFDDHFVAMEAGGLPEYARMTYVAMKPHMGDKPLRYIIPTHHHDDHAFAVHFYARIGATILTTRDKEGFMRILLERTWGDDGPVRDAKFEFIDGSRHILEDEMNRLDVFVYHDAPHTENMLVGYVPSIDTLFTADIYIGWAGESVRQGATYSATHLMGWIRDQQRNELMGEIEQFVSVHGKAYSKAEMSRMLAIERVIVTLPDNDAWPSASWFLRFGLSDDTTGKPRRDGVVENPAMM